MEKQNKVKFQKLRRRQLDTCFKSILPIVAELSSCSGTWIKEIRNALGISQTQFAKLLGISRPAFIQLEANEEKQTIELQTLRRIANAINCQLVYSLVPDPRYRGLDAILKERAKIMAKKIINDVAKTMALEDQSVKKQELDYQIQELADELVMNLDKRIWD